MLAQASDSARYGVHYMLLARAECNVVVMAPKRSGKLIKVPGRVGGDLV